MTIVFQNHGEIPLEAFTSFGVNAKESANAIGEFGTGLKYAVAVVLRLGGRIRLWRGDREYEFYTKQHDFRGKTFDWVRMRRRTGLGRWTSARLPFTTELGKKWEAWQAVREIEANCRDEGGSSRSVAGGNIVAEAGVDFRVNENETTIAVDCDEFEDAYEKLSEIFLPEYHHLILETSHLQIFRGRSNSIFFRGLKVTELRHPSLFTYNFKQGVWLTEDRTSKYPFSDDMNIRTTLMQTDCDEIIRTLIRVGTDERVHEMYLDWDAQTERTSPALLSALRSKKTGGGGWSGFGLSRLSTYYDHLAATPKISEETEVDVTAPIGSWLRAMGGLTRAGDPECDALAVLIHGTLQEAGWVFSEDGDNDLGSDTDEDGEEVSF